jgi:hypothetical protein
MSDEFANQPALPKGNVNRPSVTCGEPDFVIRIGSNLVAFYSKQLQSLGLVRYRHLLVVADPEGNELFFVTAESNPMGGANEIFLCMFKGMTHSLMQSSPLLALEIVFFLAACELTRRTLGLSTEQAPMTKAEQQAIPMLVELVDKLYPEWRSDKGSVELIDFFLDRVQEPFPDLRAQLYPESARALPKKLKWKFWSSGSK